MRVATAALLAAGVALALAACGGGDDGDEAKAKADFRAYAAAEVKRGKLEGTLNREFRKLATAAGERDRAAVVAAAERGKAAATKIDGFLATELEAAARLVSYEPTSEDARKLQRALRQSRDGLRAISEELTIALRDPFLDKPDNARRVNSLARQSLRLSVPAGFARRRAARDIAMTLDVEVPFDTMFDGERPTSEPGG